jgi:hypothetical protein
MVGHASLQQLCNNRLRHCYKLVPKKQKPPRESSLTHGGFPERATGFEPVTFSLARRRSTTEPRPPDNLMAQYRSGYGIWQEEKNENQGRRDSLAPDTSRHFVPGHIERQVIALRRDIIALQTWAERPIYVIVRSGEGLTTTWPGG